MSLANVTMLVGLLLLNGLFFWLYTIKSSRGYAIVWLVGSGLLSLSLSFCALALFEAPADFGSLILAVLTGPTIVGAGLARWRLIDHLDEKASQAKQEELFRLRNPKVFD